MRKQITLIMLAALALAGTCGKEEMAIETEEITNVYVVGFESNAPVLWKNGVATLLAPPIKAMSDATVFANSLFVSGDDVYAAGYEFDAEVPKVWKNGTLANLAGAARGNANSVFVSGDDVYVVGDEVDARDISTATLWKNGVPTALSDGARHASATSLFVSGGDVYVAGVAQLEANGNMIATVWKNGVPTGLTDGANRSAARSIFVSGDDVYVAGAAQLEANGNMIAVVWKNGVLAALSDGTTVTEALSIFVSGDDVHVAGIEHVPHPDENKSPAYAFSRVNNGKVWKNGVETPGMNGAEVHSVYVSGGDVYVAGSRKNPDGRGVATLWKNGVATGLDDAKNGSFATAVFVTTTKAPRDER
jgi:sulfur transfer complex TusBCD TusB component (DsrH family)